MIIMCGCNKLLVNVVVVAFVLSVLVVVVVVAAVVVVEHWCSICLFLLQHVYS